MPPPSRPPSCPLPQIDADTTLHTYTSVSMEPAVQEGRCKKDVSVADEVDTFAESDTPEAEDAGTYI